MSAEYRVPDRVADVRRDLCAVHCQERCAAYTKGTLDHGDPRESCPRKDWPHAWGCYGPCEGRPPGWQPAPAPAARGLRLRLGTKARRLGKSVVAWVRSGCPVTDGQARRLRKAACEACDYWRAGGNLGMGECRHPQCGCTRAKRWLATERCPAGRWPDVVLTTLWARTWTRLNRTLRPR